MILRTLGMPFLNDLLVSTKTNQATEKWISDGGVNAGGVGK
jgi:hypothetical protein